MKCKKCGLYLLKDFVIFVRIQEKAMEGLLFPKKIKKGPKMKCKKCGSKNLDTVRAGPHCKLFCCDCLAFQKFLSKADAKTFASLKGKEVSK